MPLTPEDFTQMRALSDRMLSRRREALLEEARAAGTVTGSPARPASSRSVAYRTIHEIEQNFINNLTRQQLGEEVSL